MGNKIKPISIVLFLLSFVLLNAQQTAIPEHFTVQTDLPFASIEKALDCKLIKTVEKELGIYEIKFNSNLKTWLPSFELRISDQVYHVSIQRKHNAPVLRVKSPNDPDYNKQYYYNLTKTNKLWENTTGGLNRNGDTIVVAYVDNGFDTSHADLLPNLFINYKEIPWNGIDEDSNGYTDDRNGWNGGDSNGRVVDFNNGPAHGTHVAGVIGAKGNNALGISGTNWNVKILPCVFWAKDLNETENGIYRSLGYVLKMKKLWVKTNGKKGANIVSTNLSFGFEGNNPRPVDYPIFCNLIDSLYKNGIVVACATTNNGTNITVSGDIPALCPIPGLIVTTTTNEADVFPTAGYNGFSPTDVDLAAPGFNIYSTNSIIGQQGGGYTSRSGTSFASPQVAATVGLLHSFACKYYLNFLKQNPDSGVRLMKQWILQSTDRMPSLIGKTLTGGRLNAYTAFKMMDTWCNARDAEYLASSIKKYEISTVSVFPNPCKIGSEITLQYLIKNPKHIRIYSLTGKQIMETSSINGSKIKLPDGVAAGSYIIEIVSENASARAKLILY